MNYGIARSTGAVVHAPPAAQAEFIRKVYSLFFLSVLVTVGVGAFTYQPAIAAMIMPIWFLVAIAQFVVILIMSFSRRTAGANVGLLYLFAALTGVLTGPRLLMVSTTMPGLPIQAALLTLAVFGGLTVYAFQSGKDFSFMGGVLFIGLIGLIVAGFLLFFIGGSALYTLYCVAGVLIFSGFVLYDTSNIMRQLAPGEEVTGAINLYLDLLNLFWFILDLLGILGNRRD